MLKGFGGLALAGAMVLGVWAMSATSASAEWLYWGFSGVPTRPACFQRLEQAARNAGLENIRVTPDSQVSGGANGNHTYVVLTCTPGPDNTSIAMVMVAADDDNNAHVARDAVQNYMVALSQSDSSK